MNAQLADLLCNRVTTAQKCYRLSDRERTSAFASTELAKALARKFPENVERMQSADSGNTATDVQCLYRYLRGWNGVRHR